MTIDGIDFNQLAIALGGIAFTYVVYRVHRYVKAGIAYRRRVSRYLHTSPMYRAEGAKD